MGGNDSEEIEYDNHTFPNKLWISTPPSDMVLKISIFVPIVLIAIIGNSSLLYIILKHKSLLSSTNIVIANMSLADLISVLIYPWIFLVNDFFQNYQLGACWCRVEGWLECSILLVNVMNLSVISYDRLTAIVLPQETRLTVKSAKIIIVLTWIIAFMISSPVMYYRKLKKRQWADFLEIYCMENPKVLKIYWHILLAMLVWLPLAIVLICYTAIFIKLDRYEQKILKSEQLSSVRYKSRVAKVIFMVLLTFIVCRTPFTALIFRRSQWLKTNEKNQVLGIDTIIWFVARYMIYANAAFDPLIYGLTNENFKKVFRTTGPFRILFFTGKTRKRLNNIPNHEKPDCKVENANDKVILNVTKLTENQTGSRDMLIK